MPVTLLKTKRVEKPWGRHHLYPGFPDPPAGSDPIGEVWFEAPDQANAKLLIKYLFTSELLSVQDHPSDEEAHKRGLPNGKDECWTILEAGADSTIALGPKQPLTGDELRASALDGSIEDKLNWRPVHVGEFLYSPSGTIHAIGKDLTIIEIQQNSDTTYRLYDYGRPRELHLDDGIAVATLTPYAEKPQPGEVAAGRTILTEGPKFVLERWTGGGRDVALPEGIAGWLVPIKGSGTLGDVAWQAGECAMMTGDVRLEASDDADLLFAYPGDRRI